MAQSTAGRVARVTLVGVCTLAIAALVAGVVQQAWRTNGATSAVVDLESKGAEMLHPMTTLLAELVAAQSAAVRGEPVDVETLRKALAAVRRDRPHVRCGTADDAAPGHPHHGRSRRPSPGRRRAGRPTRRTRRWSRSPVT